MAMTKEDWKTFEQCLSGPYGHVALQVDEFRLDAHCVLLDRKLVIRWYANGVFLGKWFLDDCEERRRFFRKSVKQRYSEKEKKYWIRIMGKKRFNEELRQTITNYQYMWNSPAAFKRQLIAASESIELIECR